MRNLVELCTAPERLRAPSRTSISATASSMPSPTRGGMTMLKRRIAPPTTTSVTVCPTPQTAPMSPAARTLRCWLTMVETATT